MIQYKHTYILAHLVINVKLKRSVMNIYFVPQSDVNTIELALDAIQKNADFLQELPTADLVRERILALTDQIRRVFATEWYLFKCLECENVFAVEEKDINMMAQPCSGGVGRECGSGMLVFLGKTKDKPADAVVRATF
jgi:hypothetical protein